MESEKNLPKLYLKFKKGKRRLNKPWENGYTMVNNPCQSPCSTMGLLGR